MDVKAHAAVLVAGALLGVSTLGGCSVDVPDPAAPKVEPTVTALATPTITPGHDAEAVAEKDMPFSAGGSLATGVPVGISDGLKEAPGWQQVKENVAGESQFVKADGCLVAAKVRTNQVPLALQDDKESTIGLFTYLDPTILPGYLKTATLRWGGEVGKPGPSAEVMVLEKPGQAGVRATAVMARVFGTAASSVYISVACPDDATLAAARADVAERLRVVPPSN
ncbi:hypothetical protein AU252_18105 [Pseudarthrobacter sulfonivorans]|uniref:DUF5642 domain-containing protein n=1 Tax=Pseudarthrobacter sulfonivorans TaxID=121292 RepID=A0A0U3RC80_9MICC|nr:hypothetical protein [Pseudarthrobacter sulfonivorans]ALV42833.1 hypothetical protein AU252_18105 [Pseudarthrobacter sulfonivorans]